MKKQSISWRLGILLSCLVVLLQGCLWFGGGNSGFKQTTVGNRQVGVNQNSNLFKGKIYFTIDHNLWVLDGLTNSLKQLTKGQTVSDPAVSPDGKWIAFTVRFKNYSNIEYMSVNGGSWHMLLNGNGHYYFVPGLDVPKNDFKWNAQPRWAPDSKHLLFLSDFQKEDWYQYTHYDAPVLDLQIYEMSIDEPNNYNAVQDVAYAYVGDGGNSDPSFRPGHSDQIIYTHYAYDNTRTQQVIQLFMEDPNEIARKPHGTYYPGLPGFDPGIAITPSDVQCLEPAFSPDGNTIAYIRREKDGQMGLYVMPTPEGVTTNPNDPAVEKKALLPYQQSKLLVKGQFVSQPIWSPDGKAIAYFFYSNEEFDLWLLKLNYNQKTKTYSPAGSPIQLTSGGVDGDSHPSWTA
ncbi:TolB family protein [Thermogemmatispora carboxidivorans]|uniref:TolB family protein n=1 Tax=Thermogemmatispora carboxidivorans TaxID=1382306 RepID=UPI00069AD76C|nr:PD40 domain-containing protein [Thermogemmatispora carboxidivorans]